MLQKIRNAILSESNKNTLVLLYGTVLSQALPLLFSPILARLYSPAEFGAFSLFFGIVAILGNISAGKLDLALYTATSDHNAVVTAITGLLFTGLITLLITIGCVAVAVAAPLEKLSLAAIICIPFTVLFFGCSNILVALSNRRKNFKHISHSKIILGALWVLINVLLGLAETDEIGLILGYSLGQMGALGYLVFRNREIIKRLKSFSLPVLKFNFLKNRNYAFIFLPAHLLNNASASAPSFFLSYFFGLNANGFFFKAVRVGEAPTGVVRNSVGNVFWQQASQDYLNSGNARPVMKQFLLKLIVLGVPGYLVLYLFADELFLYVFGAPWAEAATYFKILAPYFLIQFIITPVSILVVLANKPWVDITWQIFYASCIVLSFTIGWLYHDVLLGLQLYAISMILMQIISLIINYRYALKR